MLVAGHRGVRVHVRENTMEAFRIAADLHADMIETDIHMTRDGVLILMHDHAIDRTTAGTGLIREKTYAEIREVGPDVPTLEEFIVATKDEPGMTYNFELKDYPENGEEHAWESMRKTIAMVEKYDLADRCVINSFSGRLLEQVADEFGGRYKLHGFYPFSAMSGCRRDPMEYLYCACLWGSDPVGCEDWYKELAAHGVQAWVGTGVKSAEDLRRAAMLGAKLVTSDDPGETLRLLREMGRHA